LFCYRTAGCGFVPAELFAEFFGVRVRLGVDKGGSSYLYELGVKFFSFAGDCGFYLTDS